MSLWACLAKIKMKIKTKLYTREHEGNSVFKHKFLCDAEIYGKNIWISETDKLPDTPLKVIHFEYAYNKTYSKLSKNLVNTHIKYYLSKDKLSSKLFIRLNRWQRFKLKWMTGETGYQRNPIEFILLVIAGLGLIMTTFFSILDWKNSRTDNSEKLFYEIIELKEIIRDK